MHSTSCKKQWFDRDCIDAKKTRAFKIKTLRELCQLRKHKPKQFWNYFKSELNKGSNDVKPEEVRTHI